jgi:lipid-A-disaccharide synthase
MTMLREAGAADVLILAGEHSGDQHAARLVEGLKGEWKGVHIAALGGPALEQAGASLLYDLTQLAVVGLVEVLRHYSQFKQLMEETVAWIEANQPKVVILVDYPGFNLRLAERLARKGISRKGGGSVAIYQYISPQIWAWKSGRRFKMAKLIDELGVIFPFEVGCYADTELDVRFVGHPFVEAGANNPLSYSGDGPILLLPGSRLQAVGRIFPLMLGAVKALREAGEARPAVCLYPDKGVRSVLEAALETFAGGDALEVALEPVDGGTSASAVLTSSGTMSLNAALAGIPGAIVYRAHPLTVWLGRRLVKIEHLGIANLILGEAVYPEYVQVARPEAQLADEINRLSADPVRSREHFAAAAERLRELLTGEQVAPAWERVALLAGISKE